MRSGHKLELVKYRDAGMASYTYFWVDGTRTVSPYFDSEQKAHEWLEQKDKQ